MKRFYFYARGISAIVNEVMAVSPPTNPTRLCILAKEKRQVASNLVKAN